MKKVRKLRHNGQTAFFHTRADIGVIIQSYNEMANTVNELIDIVERQSEKIERLERNADHG